MLDVSAWSITAGTGTFTTDGDILTQTHTGISGSFEITRSISNLSSDTYQFAMVKVSNPSATVGLGNSLLVNYSDGTFTTVNTSPLTPANAIPVGFVGVSQRLLAGKTITSITLHTFDVASVQLVDFILLFKELLTLPTAIRPLQEQDVSIMPVIPILGRQGGQLQYLGAMSPRYTVSGGLVNTTAGQSGWTNTYTADQWWQILKGVWIEQNTIQADGNPTWQSLVSDNINGKVLFQYAPQQVPGRGTPYHDYILSLVEFNVLGLSTANLPGITY